MPAVLPVIIFQAIIVRLNAQPIVQFVMVHPKLNVLFVQATII